MDINLALTSKDSLPERRGVRTRATRDREEIRRWAAKHQAEPATGEATASGPATIDVNDGGAGIRFNFPGFGRLRPISWDEWFDNFYRHDLIFVYDEIDSAQVAERAWELWHAGGAQSGHDREDWLRAERDLERDAHTTPVRYRLIKDDTAP
jgi:hypothetical protein